MAVDLILGTEPFFAAGMAEGLSPSASDHQTVIDCAALDFATPGHLVAVAALVEAGASQGQPALFMHPDKRGVANYLARMGLAECLDEAGARHALPSVRANEALNAVTLLRLTRFSTEDDVDALLDLLESVGVPEELRDPLASGLAEAANNVPEHAACDGGFVAAQMTASNRKVHFAVGDGGVGIRASLARTRATSSDVQAIELAVEGVSGTGRASRGKGLKSICRAVREHGGKFTLLSGQAARIMTPGKEWTRRSSGAGYPGTVLEVTLPLIS